MGNKKLLKMFIPMVNFIADIVGPQCEVILHDIDDVEKSAIALRNGYISGRQIGCPLTDLGMQFLEKKVYLNTSAVINYLSCTASGEKFRSSTFFIKDDNDVLIGMLCVNIINSPDNLVVKNLTEKLINVLFANNQPVNTLMNEDEKIMESLSPSVEGVVDSAIEKVLKEYDIVVERMSIVDKTDIVQKLNSNGIFKIKGAITKVAAALQTSESTIYRYLSSK